jgi:tetratricopeptide (TPR) repeat protein
MSVKIFLSTVSDEFRSYRDALRMDLTAQFEEAVAAYRDALKERTRERVPLEWAMTHNNLGVTLLKLGDRESDMARLEEAVARYRDLARADEVIE